MLKKEIAPNQPIYDHQPPSAEEGDSAKPSKVLPYVNRPATRARPNKLSDYPGNQLLHQFLSWMTVILEINLPHPLIPPRDCGKPLLNQGIARQPWQSASLSVLPMDDCDIGNAGKSLFMITNLSVEEGDSTKPSTI
ncbi:uncharacterized protein MELLADRAFT_114735 [Melampsora larici-populina 98AG31]|uniref:Uncharacterized protein n=1 Tax=Melampsora larici-populina (strain 98AG31 / pathotype 3-4-7) TaxID=747676 RepID=F4SEK2_MELLP|nr:uncharacterized protein MELLADRAFT_114735 [Melampsora larici-populina 98AG31]EGF96924.1 hypothetical protein MELLADRAFT_114735 [Melampsora larici-populina 98AG31]